MPVKITLYIY